MSAASSSTHRIELGASFAKRESSSARRPLLSVKYNLRPSSIPADARGLLHCPNRSEAGWSLEYVGDSSGKSTEKASDAHGFSGVQSGAKDVDCALVWDEERHAYVLNRIESVLSLKYERKHGKLSAEAHSALFAINEGGGVPRSTSRTSALGLDIEDNELREESRVDVQEDTEMEEGEAGSDGEQEDDFAMQLQRDLEAFEDRSPPNEESRQKKEEGTKERDGTMNELHQKDKAGLGLMNANGLRDEVITPRGSPYIDRPTKMLGQTAATTHIINNAHSSAHIRQTPPGMSPASVANSPRPTGLESSLSASWRPPAQRSAVTLAFGDEDEDDEEEDESEDDDEEDDEEEEEEEDGAAAAIPTAENATADDDDDLDAFARELEGSLMEPATPVEEKPAKSAPRTRRSSGRAKK